MNTLIRNTLPILAGVLAVFGIVYSGCHESRAKNEAGTAVELRKAIQLYEQQILEAETVHLANVKQYGEKMGMTSGSDVMPKITAQQELLKKHKEIAEAHKMELLHTDTTNSDKNKELIKAIDANYQVLLNDLPAIEESLMGDYKTNVPK
ncbi:MAG: hypothetical protein LW750_05415 [Bacteroidetes bacterium]|nr:hypothetical protein [Bacteroidota bacterium]